MGLTTGLSQANAVLRLSLGSLARVENRAGPDSALRLGGEMAFALAKMSRGLP